jgi:hypothetical protein
VDSWPSIQEKLDDVSIGRERGERDLVADADAGVADVDRSRGEKSCADLLLLSRG